MIVLKGLIGKTIVANIIALDMITDPTKAIPHEAIEKVMFARGNAVFLNFNKKALYTGFEKGGRLLDEKKGFY